MRQSRIPGPFRNESAGRSIVLVLSRWGTSTVNLFATRPALPILLDLKPFFESAICATGPVILASFSTRDFMRKSLISRKFLLDHPGVVL
jgi:hypothetical protein